MNSVTNLDKFFSPTALETAYWDYVEARTDRYSDGKTEKTRVSIPMGADGVERAEFELDLKARLEQISKSVLNGSYQFYPLREKDVSKHGSSKVRTLSVAGIRDVLVQKQLYKALEDITSKKLRQPPLLDNVSFGYRRKKSVRQAATRIRASIKRDKFSFALDADIKQFFDNLEHERLEGIIEDWFGKDTVEGTMLKRYIHVGRIPYSTYRGNRFGWKKLFKGKKKIRASVRQKGIPQGGVLSGLLANLYLYDFDRWLVYDLKAEHGIDFRYFRYADDFIVLTRSASDARLLYEHIKSALASIGLEIHDLEEATKTRIVHITENPLGSEEERLEFLGLQFTSKHTRIKLTNVEKFQHRFLNSLRRERTLHNATTFEQKLNLTIKYYVNSKIVGPEPTICDTCGGYINDYRNWMSFFAPCVTDVGQIKQLDRWLRGKICKYFWNKYRRRIGRKQLREAGLKSLVSQYYKLRVSPKTCKCKIKKREVH